MKMFLLLSFYSLFTFCLYGQDDGIQKIKAQFTADTCEINRKLDFERQIWIDQKYYIYDLERYAYEDLGEKYAKLLIDKLNDADGWRFRETQSDWIAFYNSEVSFSAYNIPSPKFEMMLAKKVKARAIDIYTYLLLASKSD